MFSRRPEFTTLETDGDQFERHSRPVDRRRRRQRRILDRWRRRDRRRRRRRVGRRLRRPEAEAPSTVNVTSYNNILTKGFELERHLSAIARRRRRQRRLLDRRLRRVGGRRLGFGRGLWRRRGQRRHGRGRQLRHDPDAGRQFERHPRAVDRRRRRQRRLLRRRGDRRNGGDQRQPRRFRRVRRQRRESDSRQLRRRAERAADPDRYDAFHDWGEFERHSRAVDRRRRRQRRHLRRRRSGPAPSASAFPSAVSAPPPGTPERST